MWKKSIPQYDLNFDPPRSVSKLGKAFGNSCYINNMLLCISFFKLSTKISHKLDGISPSCVVQEMIKVRCLWSTSSQFICMWSLHAREKIGKCRKRRKCMGNRWNSGVTSDCKSFNFRVIQTIIRSAPQCYRVFALARINLSAQVGFHISSVKNIF